MNKVSLRYGGKEGSPIAFSVSSEFLVVRTRNRASLRRAGLSGRSRKALEGTVSHVAFIEPGVEVLRLPRADAAAHAATRRALKKDPQIRFAGRVLVPSDRGRPGKTPVVYTENAFVKFAAAVKGPEARRLLARHHLEIKRSLPWLPGGYFVGAPEGTGLTVFEMANELLDATQVEYCHPEVVQERGRRKAFPQQWHLKAARIAGQSVTAHAHVTAAWRLSTGKGITIAVIDDGIDIDHREFAAAGKLVAPRDVTQDSGDPRPGKGD